MKLPFKIAEIPLFGQNSFGGIRAYDIHTGIDLFCNEGQEIQAIEDGIVVNILDFTGSKSDSPWWNDTRAVMVEGKSGVFLYGEILPNPNIKIGDLIKEGDLIGTVLRVLKNDKGKPTTMLHLELYDSGTIEPVWWHFGNDKPKQLLDPTPIIYELKKLFK